MLSGRVGRQAEAGGSDVPRGGLKKLPFVGRPPLGKRVGLVLQGQDAADATSKGLK